MPIPVAFPEGPEAHRSSAPVRMPARRLFWVAIEPIESIMLDHQIDDRSSGVLVNDTIINVASLLQEDIGSYRTFELHLDELRLAEDVVAANVDGAIRLTRLRDEILVDGHASGAAIVECVRCLRPFAEHFEAEFAEEYRQTVDVRSGSGVRTIKPVKMSDEDSLFTIDENHELDLTETLRQHALLALPMRPDCGTECNGPDVEALKRVNGDSGDAMPKDTEDQRFAALSLLLGQDEAEDSGSEGR